MSRLTLALLCIGFALTLANECPDLGRCLKRCLSDSGAKQQGANCN